MANANDYVQQMIILRMFETFYDFLLNCFEIL